MHSRFSSWCFDRGSTCQDSLPPMSICCLTGVLSSEKRTPSQGSESGETSLTSGGSLLTSGEPPLTSGGVAHDARSKTPDAASLLPDLSGCPACFGQAWRPARQLTATCAASLSLHLGLGGRGSSNAEETPPESDALSSNLRSLRF